MNQMLKCFFDAGLLEFTLKSIDAKLIEDNFFLRIFLVNDIDTNLISIFVPELWEYENNEFVTRGPNGEIIKEQVLPCEIGLAASEAPVIKLTDEYFQLNKMKLDVTIRCENLKG